MCWVQVTNLSLVSLHALDVFGERDGTVARLGGPEAQQLGQVLLRIVVLDDANLKEVSCAHLKAQTQIHVMPRFAAKHKRERGFKGGVRRLAVTRV